MNRITTIINNVAEGIIDAYDIHVPICDINDVVTKLGGCVWESADICNSDIMKQNDGFVIYMPSFYSAERKRFAIAQELGHLFLHMGVYNKSDIMEQPKEYDLLQIKISVR